MTFAHSTHLKHLELLKRTSYQLVIIYVLAAILLYPVIAHILMYQLAYLTERLPHGRNWLYVQIFLSGPGLIIIGLILYFKYGFKILNKLLGALLVVLGIYWLYNLVIDIINEAA